MVALGFSGWLQSTVAKTEADENRRPLRLDEFVGLCDVLGQDPAKTLGKLHQPLTNDDRRVVQLRAQAVELQRQIDANHASISTRMAQVAEQTRELAALREQLDEAEAGE